MPRLVDLIVETRPPAGLRPRLRSVLTSLLDARAVASNICVILTNDARLRDLKREHWQEDATTDVLSFPQWEPGDPFMPPVLGDVFINLQAAARQAPRHGHDLEAEVNVLAAHGLTHLLGFDHEDDLAWQVFEAAQTEALDLLKALRG